MVALLAITILALMSSEQLPCLPWWLQYLKYQRYNYCHCIHLLKRATSVSVVCYPARVVNNLANTRFVANSYVQLWEILIILSIKASTKMASWSMRCQGLQIMTSQAAILMTPQESAGLFLIELPGFHCLSVVQLIPRRMPVSSLFWWMTFRLVLR